MKRWLVQNMYKELDPGQVNLVKLFIMLLDYLMMMMMVDEVVQQIYWFGHLAFQAGFFCLPGTPWTLWLL